MPSLPITPKTKVGALLEAYPELEETLISIAPAFKKLKNPVLRRTVAKVATLQQAAMTGDVPVQDIIRRLREAVGQEVDDAIAEGDWTGDIPPAPPPSVEQGDVLETLDAGPLIDRGENPLTEVMARVKAMQEAGDVLVVHAPFYPAPLIDTLRGIGLELWAREDGDRWILWVVRGAARL